VTGGLFVLWDNNLWNPSTRYVKSRIPFVRAAITLTPQKGDIDGKTAVLQFTNGSLFI
jgi:hypothetical protein